MLLHSFATSAVEEKRMAPFSDSEIHHRNLSFPAFFSASALAMQVDDQPILSCGFSDWVDNDDDYDENDDEDDND